MNNAADEGYPGLSNLTLTRREAEVAALIREGLSTKEIAWRLGMSTKTAEAHRYNLMRKLGAHNAAQVIQRLEAA